MKFKDAVVDREHRFSIGIEEGSGRCYVSIPVGNSLVDYEEYYEIDRAAFERYRLQPELALDLVVRARRREVDELLIVKPGAHRGQPI